MTNVNNGVEKFQIVDSRPTQNVGIIPSKEEPHSISDNQQRVRSVAETNREHSSNFQPNQVKVLENKYELTSIM